ncbi:SUKH-4 family immunity protein [Streptomyces sp. NPDC051453]|uniref:SUKH-4 family immunity protein n=1 Tax=Streptomyces sp. NPDC051453 TaxID=3154941 RepID=UPI003438B546
MAKASLSAADSINVAQWHSNRGTVPKERHDWLVLGLFADTTLALAPDTGMVYVLGDGEDELVYTPNLQWQRCGIQVVRLPVEDLRQGEQLTNRLKEELLRHLWPR